MKAEFIIIHHSLTRDSGTVSWGAIRTYHISRGWKDIGYHFGVELINNQYEILIGRPWNETGAHTRGINTKAIGICFVGNYDEIPPPTDMLLKGGKLISCLMKDFGIPLKNVRPHRAFADKTCPGKLFNMDIFRKIIAGFQ
jgi:hypothetical protein